MKGAFALFGLWVMCFVSFSLSLQYVDFLSLKLEINHAYHRALRETMKHEGQSFDSVFYSLVGKEHEFDISLVSSHDYPKMRRIRVSLLNGRFPLVFDETMIEERVYE